MNSGWLHRYAVLTTLATLVLVGIGGLVTSHNAGMAVPDWPTTYGYNMFFFPISKWIGGIFYEHTHRLVASVVGLLTSILTLWLYGKNARPFMRWTGLVLLGLGIITTLMKPARWSDGLVSGITGLILFGASFAWPRGEPVAKWLRNLGLIAFFCVVLQGVLGGLRVTLYKDQIGIFHGALAQLFFALVCAIALFTSRWWQNLPNPETEKPVSKNLRRLFLGATLLVFSQLVLGATMRHQHTGLAIPDFPLAYGRLWPATDPASVALYNANPTGITPANPITAFQINLQMVHRVVALLILGAVACCAWLTKSKFSWREPLTKLSALWLGLIVIQITLGAATVLSNKAADIATAHVLVGALSLTTGAMICIISFRASKLADLLPVCSGAGQTSAGDARCAEAGIAHSKS